MQDVERPIALPDTVTGIEEEPLRVPYTTVLSNAVDQ